MYRVSTPRREFGEISACAASQWEARSHPIVQSGSGAPDTIRTCGLYLRRVALYPAELRVHARPSLARSVSGWSPDSSPHGVGLPPRKPRPDARGGAEPTLERLFFGIVHEIRSV